MHKGKTNGVKDGGNDELKTKNKDIKTKVNKNKDIFYQALSLPILCNMNPRSVYKKIEEFHEFVKEEEIDILFMSESWERVNLTLDQISILRIMLTFQM